MFENIRIGGTYSRNNLAELWGYETFHAIARGVVTPRGTNKIILFVTDEKQSSAQQYEDALIDGRLHWEGPTDHFAEDRMAAVDGTRDEIHLFYRDRHHSDFEYLGRLVPQSAVRRRDQPSQFVFKLIDRENDQHGSRQRAQG